jgi:pyrroloquinoline quinone biosynthesis protein B
MHIRLWLFSTFFILFYSRCTAPNTPQTFPLELVILGTAQDGGYPQAGCKKECCRAVYLGKETARYPVSLGIVDHRSHNTWMIEASPRLPEQMHMLNKIAGIAENILPKGIFITHAHMGHYTGLMHLGREVIGAQNTPVYALPRLCDFLTQNGPWSQLVTLNNIELHTLQPDTPVQINHLFSVTPMLVPHRDEFSETAGFIIEGPSRRVLFIPDIDKWEKWERDLPTLISTVDIVLIDGTFYGPDELPGRNMQEIPHPFIVESMALLSHLSTVDKKKVKFIHLNHSNPALRAGPARDAIDDGGFGVAEQGDRMEL